MANTGKQFNHCRRSDFPLKKPVFTGVSTAIVTPFHNGTVDLSTLDRLLEFQIENGVAAITVCGTTGEAATMTEQEQNDVIVHTVERCKGRTKVIAGTGSNCTARAVCRSRAAESMGVDAVLVVTPYYNKATRRGLVEHYTAIADAIDCPVIMYNVPSRTGVDMPDDVCIHLSQHKNIAGIKEASGNICKTARILAGCAEDFSVWSGNDDQIVPMMSLGALGVISVLSNVCPRQTVEITNACLTGDFSTAGKLQCDYMELIDALFCEVNPIPVKHALHLMGYDVGEPRLPLCQMAEKAERQLLDAMMRHRLIPA